MLSMWDSLQQVIRILLYAGAGALVTAGVIDQATSVTLAGALLGVINGVWTWYWARKAATVPGLLAAGRSAAADALDVAIVAEAAVKAAKKPGK